MKFACIAPSVMSHRRTSSQDVTNRFTMSVTTNWTRPGVYVPRNVGHKTGREKTDLTSMLHLR